MSIEYTKISQLKSMGPDQVILGIAGIITAIDDPFTGVSGKTGKTFQKQVIHLVGSDGATTEAALWDSKLFMDRDKIGKLALLCSTERDGKKTGVFTSLYQGVISVKVNFGGNITLTDPPQGSKITEAPQQQSQQPTQQQSQPQQRQFHLHLLTGCIILLHCGPNATKLHCQCVEKLMLFRLLLRCLSRLISATSVQRSQRHAQLSHHSRQMRGRLLMLLLRRAAMMRTSCQAASCLMKLWTCCLTKRVKL